MRGNDTKQSAMFTSVSPASVVPVDHPLRQVKDMTDDVLRDLSPIRAHVLEGWTPIDPA
jgi:hypothetical protein